MKRCFVISPIGLEGSEVREHADEVFEFIIQPALSECDFTPLRSDQMQEAGTISDRMFHSILNDELCVALLTGHNPNVFYELAVAQCFRRPVILLIEKGGLIPFDIKDQRVVTYDLRPRSLRDGLYVKEIINHIKSLEKHDWQGPDLFGDAGRRDKDLEFFVSSTALPESGWTQLLENTREAFDIMGVALLGWRQTPRFAETVIRKATEGCKVRVLMMHLDNPILPLLASDYEMLKVNIPRNYQYFSDLAAKSPNIEVRQVRTGLMHFFISRADREAVAIQFLASQQWGKGPLWKSSQGSPLYQVLLREFDALWNASGAGNVAELSS